MVSGGHSDVLLQNFELTWFLVDIAMFYCQTLSCPGVLGRSYITPTYNYVHSNSIPSYHLGALGGDLAMS